MPPRLRGEEHPARALGFVSETLTGDISYLYRVTKDKEMIHHNFVWLALGLVVVIIAYSFMHKKIMGTARTAKS